jgi:hypothetical protein
MLGRSTSIRKHEEPGSLAVARGMLSDAIRRKLVGESINPQNAVRLADLRQVYPEFATRRWTPAPTWATPSFMAIRQLSGLAASFARRKLVSSGKS